MTQQLENGAPVDLQGLELVAEEEALHEREAALIKRLDELRRKKRRLVDPLQYAFSAMDARLTDYVPTFPWEQEQSTQEQRERIEQAGVFAPSDMCSGQATALLQSLEDRVRKKLATPKQIRLLEQRGFREVGLWSFADAQKMIARISANGWRVPLGINTQNYRPYRRDDNG